LVSLDSGPVRGLIVGNYARFLGIPYAAAPVGPLRWAPPRIPAPWMSIRRATAFANTCPQKNSSGVFARPSVTEDCLYLNVFANLPSKTLRPVLVWIHGGGLFSGESDDYDARKLVERGKLVVVTFNYRLGRLGYFPRDGHRGDGPDIANFGLMDQQFALQWVRRNIRVFGGDPRNVTIDGQSAGGESVYALLASPAGAGLFHRAIAQSGGYTPHMPSRAEAAPKGNAFASAVGCPDQSLQCLRGVSVENLLAAQNDVDTALVVDGETIPLSFDIAFAQGRFNHVPVMSGTTRDEALWFLALEGFRGGASNNGGRHLAELKTLYGADAEKVLIEYPLERFGSSASAIGVSETDLRFACPQLQFDNPISHWVASFRYAFNDTSAPDYMPYAGFPLGASHTFELSYLFPGFHGATGAPRRLDARQRRLSDAMITYWARFAASGAPGGGTGLPVWRAASVRALSLQSPRPTLVEEAPSQHHCTFWKTLGLLAPQ